MVFSGHVHAYERSEAHGVHHFVVGHGGNKEELYDRWQQSSSSRRHGGKSFDSFERLL